jgi:hypothetical protein
MKRGILALAAAAAMLAQAPYPNGPYPQAPNGQSPNGQAPNAPVTYDDTAGDSPDHAVARLSVVQGNVSVRHGDQGDLSAGVVNAPLVATDRVETAEGARAEVQFDSSNLLRLAPYSAVRLGDLQYKQYLVQVAQGTVTFRVFRDGDGQVEISTPSVSVRPMRRGVYRISVQPDGSSEITVRDGDAEISGPRGAEDLRAGRTMLTRGTTDPEFQEIAAIPGDEWDRWNSDRDRIFEQAASNRYVSPDVYGAESLDPYGTWQNDPNYGNVWVPTVSAGWAPYQQGRWVWLDYYGWTWVSDDPWGWAPYHYGRWYYGSFGWSWWPGAYGHHYYWRPALVSFFGWGGGGFGFGFGFNNVGWCPLAPYEVYRPWYGRYGGHVNVINNVNIYNNYRNARVANGITGLRSDQFGRGGVSRGNIVRPNSGDLARAGEVRGAIPFAAGRESRRFSDTAVSTRGMPQVNSNTHFFTRQGSRGNTAAPQPGNVNRASQGNFNRGGFAAQQTAPQQPQQQNRVQQQASPAGGNYNGWRRFDPSTSPRQSVQSPTGGFQQQRQVQPQAQPQSQPQFRQQPEFRQPQQSQPQFRQTQPQPQFRQPQSQPQFRQPQTQPAPQRGNFGGQRNFEAPRQQQQQRPVQINPPIVRDRGNSGGGGNAGGGFGHAQSHAGNFGGSHASGGGGGPARGNAGGGGGGGRGHR